MRRITPESTDEEIEEFLRENPPVQLPPHRRVKSVNYMQGVDAIRINFCDETRLDIPRRKLQGLEDASVEQLERVQILGIGTGIAWDEPNAAFSVVGLRNGRYGNPSWMKKLQRDSSELKASA